MSKIYCIELSKDEELMAEDMGLEDFIETDEDERIFCRKCGKDITDEGLSEDICRKCGLEMGVYD